MTRDTIRLIFSALVLSLAMSATAHGPASQPRGNTDQRAIEFPDTASHMTLVVDLHTHSVFSDGHVWPGIRVGEAIADGLDALAITEHLEWQPHLEDIPHPDRNRSFEVATGSLPGGSDLILIAGSEITRRAPHGHMNAVFIEDANSLVRRGTPPEPFDARAYAAQGGEWPAEEAVDAANDQSAFVFWNHSWSNFRSNKTELTDFHRRAARAGKLHGIEIANGSTYSPESFQIALDHGLTPIGVSDVHNLIDWDYQPHQGGHRPVNLVFTKERTSAAIREALMEGHTVVWYRNLLLGRAAELEPLLQASVEPVGARYTREDRDVLAVMFENHSDAGFELRNRTDFTLVRAADIFEVPPHATTEVLFRVGERADRVKLEFEVLNALTAPDTRATMKFQVEVAEQD